MFLLNLFFLVLNSFLLSIKFETEGSVEFLVLSLVFFYSQILGIFTILGIFGLLYPTNIFLFLFLIFLISIISIKKYNFPKFKVLNFPIYIFLSLTISLHLTYILNLLILPPLTTDGLLYHLPFAVHFYKTGSISLSNLYFTDIAMTYYPIGGEIIYLFTLLSKREFFLNFTQLPFLLLGCLSIFLIARSFGFSDFLSILSSICFSLIKPILKESSMCFVDLMMASTFITTIYFFRKKDKKYVPVGILSLSLLLSIKTLSLIFAILTLPFLFSKKTGKFSKFFYFSIFYLLIFGLFSYWRNLFLTGNPLYPAEVSIGKFILFKGSYIYPENTLLEKLKVLSKVIAFSSLHIDPSLTLKIILFILYLISLFVSFKSKELLIFHLLFPASLFLYLILIPIHYYQIRHFLPIYTILSISLINPFTKMEYFCISIFLYLFISVFPYLSLFTFLTIFFTFTTFFALISHFKKSIFYIVLSFFFFLFILFKIDITNSLYEEMKFIFWKKFYKEEGEIWEFVQKNSKIGKNIAYVGNFLLYPLYGKDFQNNVFYQSVDSEETFPVYKYRKKIRFPDEPTENIYRGEGNFEIWLSGLRNKKTDWIIVKNDKYVEKKWIENNPTLFKEIFSNQYASIYEVIK